MILSASKKDPIKLGALLLAFSALASRFLGLARDTVFSSIFGLGLKGGQFDLEAYLVAFKIPDFLYALLIFGAMSAAFIPLYAQLNKKEGKEAALLFASQVLTGLMGVLLIFSAVAWVLAPHLIPLLASGFDPEKQALAVTLTRIMLISPIFMGLSSILQGVENVHKSFYGTALAPLLYNGSIIASAYFFGPDYGVYALAYGVVIGAILHFLIQIPGTLHSGFRYRFNFKRKDERWLEFLKLSFPRLIGASAQQLSSITDVFLASFLSVGSLSVYSYAFNLQSLPYGVVAVAVSTAIYASLAEQADEPQQFLLTVRRSLTNISFWVLPAVVGLFLLREPLIGRLLERGAFDAEATERTAKMLGIFVWSALPQSFIPLLARSFYALKKTRFPVLSACLAIVLGNAFSILAIFYFKGDVTTLAYGNLIEGILNGALLFFGLAHLINQKPWKLFEFNKLLQQALAVSLMTLILINTSSWPIELRIPLGACVYLGSISLFKWRPSDPKHVRT